MKRQGVRASDVETYATASKPSGAPSAGSARECRAADPVDAERSQVVAAVVERREVPAPGVGDEPEWAQLALGFLPRVERYVIRSLRRRRIDSASRSTVSPPTGAEPHARGREVELSCSASTRRRTRRGGRGGSSRAPVDRVGRAGEPEPARGERPERDDDGLVVGEHQRQEAISGTDAVAAADATLTLDRDAEVLERGDVAPGSAPIDSEPIGDLATGEELLRLEELEQLQQPCGRREHEGSQAQIAGRICPN